MLTFERQTERPPAHVGWHVQDEACNVGKLDAANIPGRTNHRNLGMVVIYGAFLMQNKHIVHIQVIALVKINVHKLVVICFQLRRMKIF